MRSVKATNREIPRTKEFFWLKRSHIVFPHPVAAENLFDVEKCRQLMADG
jgi:hypothetical protein